MLLSQIGAQVVHLTLEQTMHELEQGLDFRMAESKSGKTGLESELQVCA